MFIRRAGPIVAAGQRVRCELARSERRGGSLTAFQAGTERLASLPAYRLQFASAQAMEPLSRRRAPTTTATDTSPRSREWPPTGSFQNNR
jgi:hypothetical protein